jgi:hypothetical protein
VERPARRHGELRDAKNGGRSRRIGSVIASVCILSGEDEARAISGLPGGVPT